VCDLETSRICAPYIYIYIYIYIYDISSLRVKHTVLCTVMAYYCGTVTRLESDGNSKHRKFRKFLDRCRVIYILFCVYLLDLYNIRDSILCLALCVDIGVTGETSMK